MRLAEHDWLDTLQWMICRANPTDSQTAVMAIKGGHNAELHNQNDLGSLIVHVGGESLITDLGPRRYDRSNFDENRYTHFVNASRGHSVPIVNGCEQGMGKTFAALDKRAGQGWRLRAYA